MYRQLFVYLALVLVCCQACTKKRQHLTEEERYNQAAYVITGTVISWSDYKGEVEPSEDPDQSDPGMTGMDQSEGENPDDTSKSDKKLWLGSLQFFKACYPVCADGTILVGGFDTPCTPMRPEIGTKITIFAKMDPNIEGALILIDFGINDTIILGDLVLGENLTAMECIERQDCSKFFEGQEGTQTTQLPSSEEQPTEMPTEEQPTEQECPENGECPSLPETNPGDIGVCTLDAKLCEDGSYVGRDPDNNCEFFPCNNGSSDCIFGTKRFGGYCACWSGAFGKDCRMGSALPGTDQGEYPSQIPNAWASSIRAIESMYYKLDFDLMIGKSFLRNFTNHPFCDSWEKVYDLETGGVPRIDSLSFGTITFPPEGEDETPVDTEEPVDTEMPTEEPIDTEIPTEEPVDTETPTEEIPTEEPVDTEIPTEEPVDTEIPTEEPVDTETPTEEIPTEEPIDTETPTEEPVDTEIPTEEPVDTEIPTEEQPTEEIPTEEPVDTETTSGDNTGNNTGSETSLNIVVSHPLVDGRADGIVFLNNDIVDNLPDDCYYPKSKYIEKVVEGCRDTWKLQIPWRLAKTCGWKISSEETHTVYRGQVVIHSMEWLTIKQWRVIRSVLRIKIRFQRFIRVDCDTLVFNDDICKGAITRQITALQLDQPALVEVTTILNYPYKLFDAQLVKYPTNNISNYDLTSIDCTSTEGADCAQNWRTSLYMKEGACVLDGDYSLNFSIGCHDSVSDCPLERGDKICRMDYHLRSEDFCAEISIDVGIFGFIICFTDNNYLEHKEQFIVGSKVYFLVKVNSDLNPRNCSCLDDANNYDESNAVIKFSSLSLFTVTIRFDSTGYILRLWEDGKICPEDFDTGIKVEDTKGDGSSFQSNQLAFSFTLSRKLLYNLQQNGKEKITVSAEVEVKYSESSKKRMAFELLSDSSDKSTFDTNPEISDDGKGPSGASNSYVLLASLLLTFILALI